MQLKFYITKQQMSSVNIFKFTFLHSLKTTVNNKNYKIQSCVVMIA